MEKKKIWKIIGLLALMWASVAGQYMQYIDTLGYGKCCLAGLIDVAVIVAIMMLIPLICRLAHKERLEFKTGKKICKWNSIGMFILSVILTIAIDGNGFVGIGGVGALIFYFINKWTFVYDENYVQNTKKIKEKKDKISVKIVEEQEESIKLETKKIKYCKLCGGKLDVSNKCKKWRLSRRNFKCN